MGLKARFILSMTAALTLVMAAAGFLIVGGATKISAMHRTSALAGAAHLTADNPIFEPAGNGTMTSISGVTVFPMHFGDGIRSSGEYYEVSRGRERTPYRLLVPDSGGKAGSDLLGMIVAILIVVVLVGAGVAGWAADQVSRPLKIIIEDVRQISRGNLDHRIHAVGGGEVELLSRAIDRMTRDLREAQETEVELSVRDRELEVAAEVRDSLLPIATPLVEGYDIGAAHLASRGFAGDFHDFVELEDGRVGLLVCDVSGTGVPAALVGATARAYLRTELLHATGVSEAFQRVNRRLVHDVRRGMFVTALYVLIDPAAGKATVACAGHKLPVLRFSAADRKLRTIHPEGIALAFDKGPVFERRLEVQEVAFEPGDRLIIANSTVVSILDDDGEELGEREFFGLVMKCCSGESTDFLRSLRRAVEARAAEDGIEVGVSLVTACREESA
jgi:sigma-B regulation protein RsbU (phosphoserine phosphatase)